MDKELHEKPTSEEDFPKDPWYKGPIKIIITLFLLLIITMWIVSFYAVKIDPEPKKIPNLDEVYTFNKNINNTTEKNAISNDDYWKLVQPNNPIIKQTADRIASIACESSSKICHAKALYYFVRDNFIYVSDPNSYEYVKTAEESLNSRGGDCDDASVLLANLLQSIGIKTEFIFIPNHVYIKAYLPEAAKRYKTDEYWVSLDATCKNCEFGRVPPKNP